ncbi:transposase [Rhizobium sp. BR 315]
MGWLDVVGGRHPPHQVNGTAIQLWKYGIGSCAFAPLKPNLKPWLNDAMTGPMSSFARRICRDVEAVHAALTLPWSSGQVEGKINKLKLIKRSMHGRAGMDLLRSRIIGN